MQTRAPFDDAIDLATLRRRTSQKWVRFPADVLPVFVAETDFPPAPNITRALHRAIDDGDLGYAELRGVGEAFTSFARGRYGLSVTPDSIIAVPEVMVGVAEVLRAVTRPGEGVVINPPVYPPFFATIDEVRRPVVQVPLINGGDAAQLDFKALERAFAAGARAYLFCNPHNPVGRVYSADNVLRVAELAKSYDVVVLADEIHAPLVLPGAMHVPFESVVAKTGVRAIAFTSASKGWNVAGLKCALAYGQSAFARDVLGRLRALMEERTGHLGVIATVAAFTSDVEYLDRVVAQLDAGRETLRRSLVENGLDAIAYRPPEASFLAWLDCSNSNLGDNPASVFLERGRVALYPGIAFGGEGARHVRFNFGTSTAIIEEAVRRMSRVIVT